jgi:hypothetical protein
MLECGPSRRPALDARRRRSSLAIAGRGQSGSLRPRVIAGARVPSAPGALPIPIMPVPAPTRSSHTASSNVSILSTTASWATRSVGSPRALRGPPAGRASLSAPMIMVGSVGRKMGKWRPTSIEAPKSATTQKDTLQRRIDSRRTLAARRPQRRHAPLALRKRQCVSG